MTALQASAILVAVIVPGTEPMADVVKDGPVSSDGLDGVSAKRDAPFPAVLLFIRIFKDLDADDREDAGDVCFRIHLDEHVKFKRILVIPGRSSSEVVDVRLQGLEGFRGP